jgi:hypothetical protein
MDPTAGLDHVTAVFIAPVTTALNAADSPLVIEIQLGLMAIPTSGMSVTVAESVGWPVAAAKMVTVLTVVIEAGAVYRPNVVMLPKLGLIDQL